MPAGGPWDQHGGGLAGVTWLQGRGPDRFLLAYTKHLMSPRLAAVWGPTPGCGLSPSVPRERVQGFL